MNKKRWKKRPTGSNWGDFGESDQIGRLNFIDSDSVLEAAKEIKTGKTFCLSLPLDYPGKNILSPVRYPPSLKPVIRNDEPYFNYKWNKKNQNLNDIASDDVVLLHTQYSTQWDSLAHRGSMFDINDDGVKHPVYYNGFAAGEDIYMNDNEDSYANALGIENMAEHGVQGRGVMVNLHKYFGEFPRKNVTYKDLMDVFEKDDIVINKGDILCFWTGLDKMILSMNKNPDPSLKNACSVLDGHDKELLKWISDSGISAIASDNLAIENVGVKIPDSCSSTLPLHEHCLFKLGIHLGELWLLAELAEFLKQNNRNYFFLTAPPLRLPGAVGSPLTPIATV